MEETCVCIFVPKIEKAMKKIPGDLEPSWNKLTKEKMDQQ